MKQKQLQDEAFPTGKPHISFSEIKQWKECPYRHKLTYIDKIDTFVPSPYLHFGTAVHEGCETLLEARQVDRDKILGVMKEEWKKAGYENPEWYSKQPGWYKHEPVETWETWANNMWDEVLDFLDKELPNWECFEAEEQLYEPIEAAQINFKGFIDGVL